MHNMFHYSLCTQCDLDLQGSDMDFAHDIVSCHGDPLCQIILNFLYAGHSYGPGQVGCFGFNGPLRQYFSLYPAVSQREGEGGEKE